jgi:hypothetical protein
MKLFLSSYEIEQDLKVLTETKPLFVLGSFFYLKKCKKDYLDKYMNYVKTQCKDFILDSGAFSMLSGSKNKESFLEKLDSYISEYIDFINRYNIKNFIELDIDKIIGYEKVKQIREKIEKETNKKSIPVFHLTRGIEEYKKLIKNYPYICIGGIAIKDIKKKDYKKIFPTLLKMAKLQNCKVHGLGFTASNVNEFDFYSVDSSSWKTSIRYALIGIFDNKKRIITYKKFSKTKKINKNLATEILIVSGKEFIKFQKSLYKGEL